jgi:uncharacterized protein (TIGR02996 family)
MDDEASFMAAILADPDENTTRLAFADWLDEQGQGGRAEFIRLQLRYAGIDSQSVHATSPSDYERMFDLIESDTRPRWWAPCRRRRGRRCA